MLKRKAAYNTLPNESRVSVEIIKDKGFHFGVLENYFHTPNTGLDLAAAVLYARQVALGKLTLSQDSFDLYRRQLLLE